MPEAENRAATNLIVLCFKHASEVDDPRRASAFPVAVLKEWKGRQLADGAAAGGWAISDEEADEIARRSFMAPITIDNSTISLGGQGGQAPGAGGGGGGAIGHGAVAGTGGEGGQMVSAMFWAEDLPDSVPIHVGRGGRGGIDSGDGEDGEDTTFGDFLRAAGGKGGKGSHSHRERQRQDQPATTHGLLRVSSALLANAAELRGGLLSVLGAAWSNYTLAVIPGVISGALAIVVEVDPTFGAAPVTLQFELLTPSGTAVQRSEWSGIFDRHGEAVVRQALLFQVLAEATVTGIWYANVLWNGDMINSVPFEVRPPSA